MRRELTTEEKRIIKKQLERHIKEKKVKEKALEYNKAVIRFNEQKREFDKLWEGYVREQNIKNLETTRQGEKQFVQSSEEDIKKEGETIMLLTDQLNNGINIKEV